MITEHDLQEAIAECQGVRNPTASTCIKLASYLTIQRELYGGKDEIPVVSGYSYDSGITDSTVEYDSGTEFSDIIHGMDTSFIMPIIDELMTAIQVVQPRLYASVIRKLKDTH